MVLILIGGIILMIVLAVTIVVLFYGLLNIFGIIERPKPRVMPNGVVISYGYCPYCMLHTRQGSYEGRSMCGTCMRPLT